MGGVRAAALSHFISTIPPHRPTADASMPVNNWTLPAATTIVAHAFDDIAQQHIPPVKLALDEEPVLSAAIAVDPHEP